MKHIFRYLWEVKGLVTLVVLTLVLQAWCDLRLPQYTADIVDIGIQQGGIADGLAERLTAASYEELCRMAGAESRVIEDAYQSDAEGNYVLLDRKGEDEAALKSVLQEQEALLWLIRQEENTEDFEPEALAEEELQETEPENAGERPDAVRGLSGTVGESSDTAGGLSDAGGELSGIAGKPSDAVRELSDSEKRQYAAAFVRMEYEALGMDLADIQMKYLWKTGGWMLAYALLLMGAGVLTGYVASIASAKISYLLRDRIFDKVMTFSNQEMDHFSIASLITRCTNDVQQVNMACVLLMRMVFYAPLIGAGGIIKVAGMNRSLGWIIVLGIVLIVMVCGFLLAAAGPKFKLLQKLVDKVNLISREMLTGILVVRVFNRQDEEERRFDSASGELMKTQLFTSRVMSLMMPLMSFIMNGLAVMIVWFGSKAVDQGVMQVGDTIAYITYSMQIVSAFLMLAGISISLPRAGVAAARIEEVLGTEVSIKDKTDEKSLAEERSRIGKTAQMERKARIEEMNRIKIKGQVEFRDVSFTYPDAQEPTLHHVSFRAEPGKVTAIIGGTGCGKSTLLRLIPRFYDVTEGAVTVDGVDVRDMGQKELRERIGFVPQKSVLFSGTIESNLKFAGESVTREKMEKAARIAQAEEFILEKSEKYEAQVSQGGTNVSGGQKQRLSIARALAKEADILLFDDSFSALDFKTDARLRSAIRREAGDAAVIIVAQRINTIMNADQILVLEEGRIVGMGRHEELMAGCRAYREIAGTQLLQEDMVENLAVRPKEYAESGRARSTAEPVPERAGQATDAVSEETGQAAGSVSDQNAGMTE